MYLSIELCSCVLVGSRLRVMVLKRNKEDSKKFTHDMNPPERRRDVAGESAQPAPSRYYKRARFKRLTRILHFQNKTLNNIHPLFHKLKLGFMAIIPRSSVWVFEISIHYTTLTNGSHRPKES